MIGNVASTVSYGQTAAGVPMANFRLAATERRYDRARGEWVDGETNWVTVNAWRWLAANVVSSLGKGDPVVVSGRLRVREWEDGGKRRSVVEIDARVVGHDLGRGTSAFRWAVRGRAELTSAQPVGEAVPEWIVEAVRAHRVAGAVAAAGGDRAEPVAAGGSVVAGELAGLGAAAGGPAGGGAALAPPSRRAAIEQGGSAGRAPVGAGAVGGVGGVAEAGPPPAPSSAAGAGAVAGAAASAAEGASRAARWARSTHGAGVERPPRSARAVRSSRAAGGPVGEAEADARVGARLPGELGGAGWEGEVGPM
ncbi:single-stranded DNA-binding protein [Kitasatospora sp. NPDC008050]|uniref:single-stranded DNA-binding protein n=1 Tax=Kitasatospora sp. NPDC008050 TaxID=3364021 RepID=UPI0036E867B0